MIHRAPIGESLYVNEKSGLPGEHVNNTLNFVSSTFDQVFQISTNFMIKTQEAVASLLAPIAR